MSWGYNLQQRRTIQGTVPAAEQVADAVIRKLAVVGTSFSNEFSDEFHTRTPIIPTADQIAEAVLRRMLPPDDLFSNEFGAEFQPGTSHYLDWRVRVRQLEQFQLAATNDLKRQKNINNEFVKAGILQQDELDKLT